MPSHRLRFLSKATVSHTDAHEQGPGIFLDAIACDRLREAHIESPYVFKKDKRKRSKRVDIQLTVDMLTQARRKNYKTAVLLAGDDDYVPLVKAVKDEGALVILWAVESGLSVELRRCVDHYADIGEVLFASEINPLWR